MVVGRRSALVLALSLASPGFDGATVDAAAAEAGRASFQDEGDRSSLLAALKLARSALGREESAHRRRLTSIIESVGQGQPLGKVLAEHTRVRREVEVLLTGYYEPILKARRKRAGSFRYPLYGLPSAGAERRATRREIDQGALARRGLELFWLEDPVESFFLHVQGSGRLELGDGSTVRVGYAGNNGHSYRSIGAELVSRGVFSAAEATAPAIKKWLRTHPNRAFEVMHSNPRFIYFRQIDVPPDQGPIGAMGVPLVPFRSVAADPRLVPPGSIGLLTALLPDGSRLRRVVIAMDVGAAIRGPSRADLFLGAGLRAERLAGELRTPARLVWLE